jgi:hypothetical protein
MAIAVAYDVRVSSSASAVKLAKAIVPGTGVIAAVGGSIRGGACIGAGALLLLVRVTEVHETAKLDHIGKTHRRVPGAGWRAAGRLTGRSLAPTQNEQDHGNSGARASTCKTRPSLRL